jgi:aminopeptidase N
MKGGHPDLAVAVQPGKGDVTVRVEQRQPVDELTPRFRFKLGVRVETDEGAVERMLEVTDSPQSFQIPVKGKVKWVAVDPGAHLLHSGKVEQSEEAWIAALAGDRDGATRVRAARSLVENPTPAAVKALAAALSGDKLWFVRAEAASALSRAKGDAARDALIAAAGNDDPRVRRAVASSLGSFRGDEKAAAALVTLLAKTEKSPGVLQDAAVALGRTRTAGAFDRLVNQIERTSWNDLARRGAVVGLGELGDDRALPTVLAETHASRTEGVRASAAHALSKLGRDKETDRDAIRERLEHMLTTGTLRAQLTAAGALVDRREERSIGVLSAQAARDLDGRTKRTCRLAATAIATGKDRGDDVKRLRDDLGRLDDENKRLRDRIERLESKRK